MLRKVTVIAVLIALIVAAFPTTGVLAKGPKIESLQTKWEQLTKVYTTQSLNHDRIHKEINVWLKTNKDATASDKVKVQVHLATCNSAFASIQMLVKQHPGFDAKGKVIDVVAATKSVKDLANLIRLHTASIKNITGHIQ